VNVPVVVPPFKVAVTVTGVEVVGVFGVKLNVIEVAPDGIVTVEGTLPMVWSLRFQNDSPAKKTAQR